MVPRNKWERDECTDLLKRIPRRIVYWLNKMGVWHLWNVEYCWICTYYYNQFLFLYCVKDRFKTIFPTIFWLFSEHYQQKTVWKEHTLQYVLHFQWILIPSILLLWWNFKEDPMWKIPWDKNYIQWKLMSSQQIIPLTFNINIQAKAFQALINFCRIELKVFLT